MPEIISQATDHFEVRNIPGWKFPKVKGLKKKNLLRSEKDHQGADRVKWSTTCPKAKISRPCHFNWACEYIKNPEVKSHFTFSSHYCSSPTESIETILFSHHDAGMLTLKHAWEPPGELFKDKSEAPPPERQSEVSPPNLYFNVFQVVHDQTVRSLGTEVPQPWK